MTYQQAKAIVLAEIKAGKLYPDEAAVAIALLMTL